MIPSIKRIIIAATQKDARFFESHGLLIKDTVKTLQYNSSHHHHADHHTHSSHHHNDSVSLEKETFSREIVETLKKITTEDHHYQETVFLAEPKMLGFLKKEFEKNHSLPTLSRTFAVDPAHMDQQTIEHKVFE